MLRIEDLVLTERVHDLGRAEIKYPDPEDLLELPGIGYAPANQVWLFLADGLGLAEAAAIAAEWDAAVVGEFELLPAFQLETSDVSIEQLLVRLSQAAESDGVELVMPNLLINTAAGTITTEMCDNTTNASYTGDLARPYQMIGLRDAWTMVRSSGLELSRVNVGVLDTAVYGLSPEMSRAEGPSLAGLVLEHLQGSSYEESGSATHGTVVMHVIAADHRLGGAVGVASIMGGQLSVTASDRPMAAIGLGRRGVAHACSRESGRRGCCRCPNPLPLPGLDICAQRPV